MTKSESATFQEGMYPTDRSFLSSHCPYEEPRNSPSPLQNLVSTGQAAVGEPQFAQDHYTPSGYAQPDAETFSIDEVPYMQVSSASHSQTAAHGIPAGGLTWWEAAVGEPVFEESHSQASTPAGLAREYVPPRNGMSFAQIEGMTFRDPHHKTIMHHLNKRCGAWVRYADLAKLLDRPTKMSAVLATLVGSLKSQSGGENYALHTHSQAEIAKLDKLR